MRPSFALLFAGVTAIASIVGYSAPLDERRDSSCPQNFLCGEQSGSGTPYEPGLGACGFTNTADQLVAALSIDSFDRFPGAGENPTSNPICGQMVTASFQGKSVNVMIVDACGGCSGSTDLDFSPAAFSRLADESLGRIDITWEWA